MQSPVFSRRHPLFPCLWPIFFLDRVFSALYTLPIKKEVLIRSYLFNSVPIPSFLGRISLKKSEQTSGLCGIWPDDKSAEEIIDDIHKHRTGFGGREVRL